jgi:hypothetical protein
LISVLMTRANPTSQRYKKTVIIVVATRTTIVELIVSVLPGHVTFLISNLTSLMNWIVFSIIYATYQKQVISFQLSVFSKKMSFQPFTEN